MSTTYIRNPAECERTQAELDKMKDEANRLGYAQGDFLKIAALEESILIYNNALLCGYYYKENLPAMIAKYVANGGNRDELFVVLSHGIDDELHPHAGCLIQLSYYSDADEGGIKDGEYLFTGLIPRITKAKYKEITSFFRKRGIRIELNDESLLDKDVWVFSRPFSERLSRWKLLKSDARRVYTGENHD